MVQDISSRVGRLEGGEFVLCCTFVAASGVLMRKAAADFARRDTSQKGWIGLFWLKLGPHWGLEGTLGLGCGQIEGGGT